MPNVDHNLGASSSSGFLDPGFLVREQASAEREASSIIDSERDERIAGRAQENEDLKNEHLANVRNIVEHPEDFAMVDKRRRLKEYYGDSALKRGEKSLPGYQREKSWLDIFIKSGKKAATQAASGTGILMVIGGITLGSATALLTAPALAGLGLAVAGGALGRTVYEAYRKISGKEQKERNLIDRANEAIAMRIGELSDEASITLARLRLDNPTAPSTELEKSPEYLNIVNEIIELMYDDSSRRVRMVTTDNGERFEALKKGEQAGDGERVVNIREAELALRSKIKNAERVSDVVATISSIGSGMAVSTLAGGALGEFFARKATEETTTALARGEVVGPYDFDANTIVHKIKAISEGMTGHMDRLNDVWQDTISNMRPAIFKAELAKAAMHLGIGAVSGVAGGLVNLFSSRFWRGKEQSGEGISESASNRVSGVKSLFGEANSSAAMEGADTPAAQTEVRGTENGIIQPGIQIRISNDIGFRNRIGLHSSLNDLEYFTIIKHENGMAVLVPLRGDGRKEDRRGYPRIDLKDLDLKRPEIRRNIIVMGKWVEPAPTEKVEEVGATFDSPLEQTRKNISIENDDRFEASRNLAQATLDNVDKYEDLNTDLTGEDREREIDKLFKNETLKHWLDIITVHYNKKDGEKYYYDLDVRAAILVLKKAGFKSSEIYSALKNHSVEAGKYEKGRLNIDTGNKEGISVASDNKTIFVDHHSEDSPRDSSAAKHLYEAMLTLHLLERDPILDKVIEFTTYCDNKNYPNQEQYFDDYDRTMLGLSIFMSEDSLYRFFKDGKTPTDVLSDDDLRNYGLIFSYPFDKEFKPMPGKRIDQRGGVPYLTVNRQEQQRFLIDQAKKIADKLIADGFTFETDEYGKVLINPGISFPLGVDAAYAKGFDTYMIWSEKGYFISTKKDFYENGLSLPNGRLIRRSMYMGKTEGMTLAEVLEALAGKEIELSGNLEIYSKNGNYQFEEAIVSDEDIEDLNGAGHVDIENLEKEWTDEKIAEKFKAEEVWIPTGEDVKCWENKEGMVRQTTFVGKGGHVRKAEIVSAFEDNKENNTRIFIKYIDDMTGEQTRSFSPNEFIRAFKPESMSSVDKEEERQEIKSLFSNWINRKLGELRRVPNTALEESKGDNVDLTIPAEEGKSAGEITQPYEEVKNSVGELTETLTGIAEKKAAEAEQLDKTMEKSDVSTEEERPNTFTFEGPKGKEYTIERGKKWKFEKAGNDSKIRERTMEIEDFVVKESKISIKYKSAKIWTPPLTPFDLGDEFDLISAKEL